MLTRWTRAVNSPGRGRQSVAGAAQRLGRGGLLAAKQVAPKQAHDHEDDRGNDGELAPGECGTEQDDGEHSTSPFLGAPERSARSTAEPPTSGFLAARLRP